MKRRTRRTVQASPSSDFNVAGSTPPAPPPSAFAVAQEKKKKKKKKKKVGFNSVQSIQDLPEYSTPAVHQHTTATMAVDAMEIDSNPTVTELPERKRKHKSQDPSSKKKRKNESGEKKEKKSSKSKDKTKTSSSSSSSSKFTAPDSPYTLTTATLYLPLSPISISPTHALASLLAEHLSPLLLTYYPPLKGIVLAYSNASISSTPPNVASASSGSGSGPQPLTLATSANEYGVLYVYLTATFLVFRPQKGQILEGWVNVQSEGFLGAVVLNLFSVGIERKRLPSDWKWIPPGEESDNNTSTENNSNIKTDEDSDAASEKPSFNVEKEHFQPVSLASDANPLSETTGAENDDDAAVEGYFQSVSGHRVRGTVKFRVLDIDVIPGTDRERGFLSIEGTMLSPEEEERVTEDEKNGILSTATPRRPTPSMSGALPGPSAKETEGEAEGEAEQEPAETPSKPKTKKTDDKEKKKSKSKKKDKEKEKEK